MRVSCTDSRELCLHACSGMRQGCAQHRMFSHVGAGAAKESERVLRLSIGITERGLCQVTHLQWSQQEGRSMGR